MNIIKIALGVFLGLILTAVVGIGGTVYVSGFVKNEAENYGRCLAVKGYTEDLIRADLFDREKPNPPTALSFEDRELVENTTAGVLTEYKQDIAKGGRALPSDDLIAQAYDVMCE